MMHSLGSCNRTAAATARDRQEVWFEEKKEMQREARHQRTKRRTEPACYSEPGWSIHRLARGPPEHTTPEDVQVEVVDTLTTVLAIVHHNPKTAVTKASRLGHSRGGCHQVPKQGRVLRGRQG